MKDIKGYEGLYAITEDGRVWSYKRQKFLSPGINGSGYYHVKLGKDGIWKNERIHQLVARTFIPNPDNLPCVNHKDENKCNNNASNLEWCTQQYNVQYSGRVGRPGRPVFCIELNQVFDSLTDAAQSLGLLTGNLGSALVGRYKTCGGYHWQYA